jgi:hypothetical protein
MTYLKDIPFDTRSMVRGAVIEGLGSLMGNKDMIKDGRDMVAAASDHLHQDYQQIKDDLDVVDNTLHAVSQLPTGPRMQSDVGLIMEGGFATTFGAFTGSKEVRDQGYKLLTGARDDFFKALGEQVRNVLSGAFTSSSATAHSSSASSAQPSFTITYDESAPHSTPPPHRS